MTTTLGNSDHTSIKMWIDYSKKRAGQYRLEQGADLQSKSLMLFAGNHRQLMPKGLMFNLIA